jgi:hypothetical protein
MSQLAQKMSHVVSKIEPSGTFLSRINDSIIFTMSRDFTKTDITPQHDRRQATGDRRQATGDRRQATGDRRQAYYT